MAIQLLFCEVWLLENSLKSQVSFLRTSHLAFSSCILLKFKLCSHIVSMISLNGSFAFNTRLRLSSCIRSHLSIYSDFWNPLAFVGVYRTLLHNVDGIIWQLPFLLEWREIGKSWFLLFRSATSRVPYLA